MLSLAAGACGADTREDADGGPPTGLKSDAKDPTAGTSCGGRGADALAVVCGEAQDHARLPAQAAMLEGCTWWRGSVHVPDASSPDVLTPLGTVVRVDGTLTVFRNHVLSDLRGLERLQSVGGELSIRLDDTVDTFASVDGLECLREVGGLRLEFNPGLRSLAGLAALEVVHGDVHIEGNRSLPPAEIEALLERVRVEGDIVVADNGP